MFSRRFAQNKSTADFRRPILLCENLRAKKNHLSYHVIKNRRLSQAKHFSAKICGTNPHYLRAKKLFYIFLNSKLSLQLYIAGMATYLYGIIARV